MYASSTPPRLCYLTLSNFLAKTSAIPGVTGCYQLSDGVELSLPFILLFALELGVILRDGSIYMLMLFPGLITLTLTRAVQSWRITRYPLLAVLLKHNIFYYACGLCKSTQGTYPGCSSMLIDDHSHSTVFSALNVLVSLLLNVRAPFPF
jgi:hypothetical protein